MSSRNGGVPDDAHEWVSFEDPDEQRTWVFDVTFLLSPWDCIYGRGCQGVLTGPAPELAQGCCSYGAHFTDAADVKRVQKVAATLTDDEWQFAKQARARGVVKTTPGGETVSRLVQGACIFLNRPGFHTGAGCVLHQAALRRGRRPLDLKPDVCWQLPIRREDETEPSGCVRSTIREWKRSDWGTGGQEFHWWCTDTADAFVGAAPVYRSMAAELAELVGSKIYAMLVGYLERRQAAPLPHPVLRVRAHT